MAFCIVEGCGKPRFGHGLCNMHYQRMRTHGTLELRRHRNLCTVAGCNVYVQGHGLCERHYTRWLRHGSTDDPRPTAGQRFWSKVEQSAEPNGCWLWQAKINLDGYGIFWFEGRSWFAHRWLFEQRNGPVGQLSLDHLCRNRACVNPAHLEPISIGENVLRGYGFAARNARKTHCLRGHPFDTANTYRMKDGGRMCRTCANLRRHQGRHQVRSVMAG